ncbi:hypothetical protein ACQ4LE_001832, partial [Meloidogyne hapla]
MLIIGQPSNKTVNQTSVLLYNELVHPLTNATEKTSNNIKTSFKPSKIDLKTTQKTIIDQTNTKEEIETKEFINYLSTDSMDFNQNITTISSNKTLMTTIIDNENITLNNFTFESSSTTIFNITINETTKGIELNGTTTKEGFSFYFYLIIGGSIGIIILFVIIFVCFCFILKKKKKKTLIKDSEEKLNKNNQKIQNKGRYISIKSEREIEEDKKIILKKDDKKEKKENKKEDLKEIIKKEIIKKEFGGEVIVPNTFESNESINQNNKKNIKEKKEVEEKKENKKKKKEENEEIVLTKIKLNKKPLDKPKEEDVYEINKKEKVIAKQENSSTSDDDSRD